ncbi:hypothetical protein ACQHIV_28230 [Kribbella sp. GL6]|uniref:hypothetical protein n=1 Tax=Kribbella sp. GL6 TaxID=3419765 RepID=UPI003D02376C
MGQFSRYVESGDPPPVLRRGFLIIVPCAAVLNAIFARQLDEILIAVMITVQFLPAGIAPNRQRTAVEALNRRPFLRTALWCILGIGWLFVVLSQSLSRLTSLYIAIPATLALTAAAAALGHKRRRSTQAAQP